MAANHPNDAANRRERNSPRAGIRMQRLGPSRLSLELRGHLGDDDGAFIAGWLDEMLPGCEHAVIDFRLEALESYTPAVRTQTQTILKRHSDRWTKVVCLIRSRIVAMGVAVANVALGGRIQAVTDRAAFDEAIAAASQRAPEG